MVIGHNGNVLFIIIIVSGGGIRIFRGVRMANNVCKTQDF